MNNIQKRNQHKIKLFHFHEISECFSQLIAPENIDRTITVSNSIYLDQLQQVVAAHDPFADFNDSIFMLKANNIDEDDPVQLALFERVLREGITYKGEKYVRSIKSPAMGRTQRTEFIKEKYYENVFKRVALGKFPNLTNINKWEAALGVSRSSALAVPYIPRIVVIPDYEKEEIIEDVWKVVHCIGDSVQQEMILAEKKKQREYFKAKKDLIPSAISLAVLPRLPNKKVIVRGEEITAPDQSEHKTFSGWDKENRRVRLDQIGFPLRSAEFNGELRPCYAIEQTEEIPIIEITEESIGMKREEHSQYKNNNVQFFDGQGLMSFQFAERIGQHLGLSYSPNAVQGRLPYIKGNFIRFDILEWFEENEVSGIVDVFNELQPIVDKDGRSIDLILTKSCFKAWHSYVEGKEKSNCLFENISEYERLLTKHHHHSFWVANFAKPSYQLNPYTPFTYQYIHALDLTLANLYDLSRPMMNVIKRVLYGNKDDSTGKWLRDISYTKAFLNMLVQDGDSKDENEHDEEEETPVESQNEKDDIKQFASEIIHAIDLNVHMIYDGNVRRFIVKQALLKVVDMQKGRIPIRGSYYYMTNDPIAFMEHASGKSVKGLLKRNQACMSRKIGTHALFRSPLTIFNEVAKLEFVKVRNPYMRHLDNVIVLNCKDLTLARLGLADVDGDTALCTNDPTILAAVLDAPTIINEDDKKTAAPVPNTIDSIVRLELKSLHNLTGRCTNVNSFFQNLALEEGNLQARVLENACLKFLQGSIIDTTKNGMDVEIPYVLDRFASKLPYYFRFINGGTADEYQRSTKTPFNQFCVEAEKYITNNFKMKNGKLDASVLGIESTKQLLQDFDKVSQVQFMKYIEIIEPIYTEYNKRKGGIDFKRKRFNELKKWERDNDIRKAISAEYRKLREDYMAKCTAICPYPSILASVAVELAYHNHRTFGFAWLFVDGLLENLKKHENVVKKEVKRVDWLTNRSVENDTLSVKEGIASIADLTFKLNAPDGEYKPFEIIGQYYIWFEAVRETVVETSQTFAQLDGRSTRKPLKGYLLGFSTLKKSEEETQSVVNDVAGKKFNIQIVNKQFVNIVDDNGSFKCCVTRDCVINRDDRLSLLDFDGADIEFADICEVYKSSFKAVVHIN